MINESTPLAILILDEYIKVNKTIIMLLQKNINFNTDFSTNYLLPNYDFLKNTELRFCMPASSYEKAFVKRLNNLMFKIFHFYVLLLFALSFFRLPSLAHDVVRPGHRYLKDEVFLWLATCFKLAYAVAGLDIK